MDADSPEGLGSSLRFRILEVELHAAEMRADEYRKVLLSFMGEDAQHDLDITSIFPEVQPRAVPQPSSSPAKDPGASLLAPYPPLAHFPVPSSSPAPARVTGPIRSPRREAVGGVLAVAREARVRASPGPGTSSPRPADRRVTRSQALSIRNDGCESTSSHAPTVFTGNTHGNEIADDDASGVSDVIQEILDGTVLAPYSLSWGEKVRANMTPGISRLALARMFGGNTATEWPECDLDPNYRQFFIADAIGQPFVPTSIGDRGLALFGPAWTDGPGGCEEGHIFHVFVSMPGNRAQLKYVGTYTAVSLPQEEVDWSLLPAACQRIWLKRLYSSLTSAARAFRARVKLRVVLKREPSVAEVQGGMRGMRGMQANDEKPTWTEILTAFKSGKEKMRVMGIKCERYDSHLAFTLAGHSTNTSRA